MIEAQRKPEKMNSVIENCFGNICMYIYKAFLTSKDNLSLFFSEKKIPDFFKNNFKIFPLPRALKIVVERETNGILSLK